jgi:hypothetical protein
MYITGAPDSRWDNNDLQNLGQVPASAFEVVQISPLYTSANLPQGTAPTIGSFTASSSTISTGGSTTLNWTVSGASYLLLAPIGGVRGNSITVSPAQTTTYTLYATNQYGRASATLTISVQ